MRANGYPADWPAIAKAVKDAADWQCIRCGHAHEPATGYMLTVHHLDMDKANCAWWNLTALCQRCHLNHDRHAQHIPHRKFGRYHDREEQGKLEL